MEKDIYFMRLAILQAQQALAAGEVPVGAVITIEERIIAEACNRPIASHDPSAHAEILAMRMAGERTDNYRLVGTTLYVTVEPCIMCAGAIIQARVGRLVYGAEDPKGGGVRSLYGILEDSRLNHAVKVTGGLLEQECGEIMSRFFRQKRIQNREVIS
jgi:tRNA(adenine34) deaminase